ncbi:MAG TPA: hypothetical protein VK613_12150 [Gaiellaceae bacterium]|nr:hypothetical protein [Gaiellaceae bacterium]
MENDRNIAAVQLSKARATTVERDARRALDREPDPAAVELAQHEPRRTYPDDETAIDGFRCCRDRRREHERGTKHQPEPSHARILVDLGQSRMCSM